jgi:hypothetical protein
MAPDDPNYTQTPDGTFVFERTLPDGRRVVALVLPEDVDEIAGPASATPDAAEKRRRKEVAKLLAEMELDRLAEPPNE